MDLLTDFLQAVLDLPASEYSHLTIVDPHLKRARAKDKLGVLDLKVHTTTRQIIDVEIQVSEHKAMRERIVFYTTKMLQEQIQAGSGYENIRRVISILITDFRLIVENGAYHNHYQFYDPKTGSCFTDLLEIDTLELPKLPAEPSLEPLENWLRFLKARTKKELAMLAKTNPVIAKAARRLTELSADEKVRLEYERREKARRDEHARMLFQTEKAHRQGLQQGEKKKALEIAKKALLRRLPIKDVADLTALPLKDIKALAAEMTAQ